MKCKYCDTEMVSSDDGRVGVQVCENCGAERQYQGASDGDPWSGPTHGKTVDDFFPPPLMPGEEPDPEPLPEKEAVNVELVQYPPWDQVERMLVDSALAPFGYQASKYEELTTEEREHWLHEMIEGGALKNSLEGVKYVFYIEGISKTVLAQLTRHRIGASWTSVTSGNFDQRHTPYIVPDAVTKNGYYDEWVEKVQEVYELYAEMVDSGIALECAREILPQAIHNYNIMTVNFRALHDNIWPVRGCDPGQPVVWNYLLDQIKEEIAEVHPILADQLTFDCSKCPYPDGLAWPEYNQFKCSRDDCPPDKFDDFEGIYDQTAAEMREP